MRNPDNKSVSNNNNGALVKRANPHSYICTSPNRKIRCTYKQTIAIFCPFLGVLMTHFWGQLRIEKYVLRGQQSAARDTYNVITF